MSGRQKRNAAKEAEEANKRILNDETSPEKQSPPKKAPSPKKKKASVKESNVEQPKAKKSSSKEKQSGVSKEKKKREKLNFHSNMKRILKQVKGTRIPKDEKEEMVRKTENLAKSAIAEILYYSIAFAVQAGRIVPNADDLKDAIKNRYGEGSMIYEEINIFETKNKLKSIIKSFVNLHQKKIYGNQKNQSQELKDFKKHELLLNFLKPDEKKGTNILNLKLSHFSNFLKDMIAYGESVKISVPTLKEDATEEQKSKHRKALTKKAKHNAILNYLRERENLLNGRLIKDALIGSKTIKCDYNNIKSFSGIRSSLAKGDGMAKQLYEKIKKKMPENTDTKESSDKKGKKSGFFNIELENDKKKETVRISMKDALRFKKAYEKYNAKKNGGKDTEKETIKKIKESLPIAKIIKDVLTGSTILNNIGTLSVRSGFCLASSTMQFGKEIKSILKQIYIAMMDNIPVDADPILLKFVDRLKKHQGLLKEHKKEKQTKGIKQSSIRNAITLPPTFIKMIQFIVEEFIIRYFESAILIGGKLSLSALKKSSDLRYGAFTIFNSGNVEFKSLLQSLQRQNSSKRATDIITKTNDDILREKEIQKETQKEAIKAHKKRAAKRKSKESKESPKKRKAEGEKSKGKSKKSKQSEE